MNPSPGRGLGTRLLEQGSRFELHALPDMGHGLWTTEGMMNVTYPMVTFLMREFPPDPR